MTGVTNLLLDLYTKCVTRGDASAAKRQLRMHQREHIAWERDTVWRQMIGQARRGEGEPGGIKALGGTLLIEEENGLLDVQTPAGHVKLKSKHVFLLISIIIFVILLNVQVVDGIEANRCFAILVFATVMWATEAIPLFVTSMFIPMLLVTLRVIRSSDGEERLSAQDATKYVRRKYIPYNLLTAKQIHLLSDVFADDHAAYRRLHHCVCSE